MGVKDSFLGKLLGNADKYSDEQVSQTIELLIANGAKHGATDIHLEPHDHFGAVRYRIDGALRSTHKIPIAALPAVIAEIKNLADIPSEHHRLPYEGQYIAQVGDEEFEVQVNTLPVVGGEKVVLHLLRHQNTPLPIESLGFWGDSLQTLRTSLSHTHGLILTGIPRRNGKTTTLHSILKLIAAPTISVATIENTVEYRLPGASQTIVRPHQGITYHRALQATLNQDPNVIMLTHLTDKATAELAVQASLGGHLVIAGLHADSAAKTLTHLRALVNEPFLLATTLRAVISQRLVRILCTNCRERYAPNQEQIAELEKTFGITTDAAKRKLHELEQQAMQANIGGNTHASTTPSRIIGLWRASNNGCEHCQYTGYRGVTAANEVLAPSDRIQKAILGQESARKIHEVALKDSLLPMELDGLIKALRGHTTAAEVLRVFGT